MKNLIGKLLIAICAVSFISCEKEEPFSQQELDFTCQKDPGIYVSGQSLIRYDKYDTQVCRNSERTMFRIQNNDQSEYIMCKFSADPQKEENIEIDFDARGVSTAIKRSTFRLLKKEPAKVWLWSAEGEVGIIALTE